MLVYKIIKAGAKLCEILPPVMRSLGFGRDIPGKHPCGKLLSKRSSKGYVCSVFKLLFRVSKWIQVSEVEMAILGGDGHGLPIFVQPLKELLPTHIAEDFVRLFADVGL